MRFIALLLTAVLPSVSHAAPLPVTVTVTAPAVTRPAENTGTGYFVVGSTLYDPAGAAVQLRGVNDNHWDQSKAGLGLTGASAVRLAMDFKQPAATLDRVVTSVESQGLAAIIGSWGATCKTDTASLSGVVDTWVAQAALWRGHPRALVNIVNEWGPSNSVIWRDNYITAVQRLRTAGYTQLIVVDSGGCGQDAADVILYGAAVLAADPMHNVLFDVHVYGAFKLPGTLKQQDYATSMTKLKQSGLAVMLGEFGPGMNVGPSPTPIAPETVVTTAESYGWSWLAWSWNDNNLTGCKTTDTGWFGMTSYCSRYTGKDATELTAFGRKMVPMLKGYSMAHSLGSGVVLEAPAVAASAPSAAASR